MKNSKGFTLIELLAVIVILAIIALIAVPIILNVIEKSKKESAESSAYGYIDAVEKYAIIAEVNEELDKLNPGTYSVSELNSLGVSVKGEKPTSGEVTVNNKKSVSHAELIIDGYKIICENGICSANEKVESNNVSSEEVGFTPTDTNWNVSTVKEALDDLTN